MKNSIAIKKMIKQSFTLTQWIKKLGYIPSVCSCLLVSNTLLITLFIITNFS